MVMIPLFEWGDGGFAGDGAEVVLQRPCVDLEDSKTVLRKLLEYAAIEADRWCGWWHVAKRNIERCWWARWVPSWFGTCRRIRFRAVRHVSE